MASKGFKGAMWYFAALLAVIFGMDWGFSHILSVHGERLSKKRHAVQATLSGAP